MVGWLCYFVHLLIELRFLVILKWLPTYCQNGQSLGPINLHYQNAHQGVLFPLGH
jgi:hypothetical protein